MDILNISLGLCDSYFAILHRFLRNDRLYIGIIIKLNLTYNEKEQENIWNVQIHQSIVPPND